LLIEVEESLHLFKSVGFTNSNLSGIHHINYVKPDWFYKSISGTWGLWKTGLSQALIDMVHKDLHLELKKRSNKYGFMLTSYLIHATGKKSANTT
jgi:hypothetical protein